jgi:hypothetical protein
VFGGGGVVVVHHHHMESWCATAQTPPVTNIGSHNVDKFTGHDEREREYDEQEQAEGSAGAPTVVWVY